MLATTSYSLEGKGSETSQTEEWNWHHTTNMATMRMNSLGVINVEEPIDNEAGQRGRSHTPD